MTTEYCSELLERMQNALNRWNEVAESCQRDDILWDAQTINEMKELAANFDTYRETYSEEELCPGLMVERFLRQTLSSVSVAKGVNHYSLDRDCKEIIKGAKEHVNNQLSPPKLAAWEVKVRQTSVEYQNFSCYHHTREHSMMALIPVLPNLSSDEANICPLY